VSTTQPATRRRDSATDPAPVLPAWPVLTLLWGFPVFWLLGATVITGVALAAAMLSYLAQARFVRIVPGVPALAAFLLWVVPCALMIDSAPRLLGYFYRCSILLVVATAFVYTLSAASTVTRRRVVHALTFVWFVTVVGGVVGLAIPEVRLTTPVGLLMPDSLTSNPYVHDLFFPPMAEVQHPYGSPQEFVRPSAPFPYANSWGVALVLLTPVAVACFLLSRSWWLRGAIIAGLGVAVVPAMASSNRGMFAGLVLAAVYVVVRLAIRNRAAPVIAIASLGVVGAAVLVANGLLTQISTRQEYGKSTDLRASVYAETFERTLQSPLLGYGAPRPSLVNEVSAGTQGYVWMLMFSYGFVGLALFLVFLWGTTFRTRAAPGDVDLVLHSVLVVASVIIGFYGLDIMQLLTVVLVAAVLLRRRYGLDADAPGE
jgi:hypothetical protein